ncbi:MAG: CPBP family intramembrane metalloprotease [Firmicutes bacterium]|nr:CPBP family intramembrane metalloprotease [Bacillota bacterium]
MFRTGSELRVLRGVLVFVLSVVALMVLGAPMQDAWGMLGLALTELMLLAIAIFSVHRFRWDWKEVFPLDIPTFRQVWGVVVFWFASYLAVYVTTMILFYFFPGGMGEVSTALTGFFTSVPRPLALLVVAVLPGLCEEVLHRGLILYTLQGKSKWLTILVMALIFGFFHLDLYRFVGTALLGGSLTYVMLKTNNLVLPILLHVLNNAVTASLAFMDGTDGGPAYIPLSAVGSALVLASVAPFLFVQGSRLLRNTEGEHQRGVTKRTRVVTSLLALLFLLVGTLLIAKSTATAP